MSEGLERLYTCVSAPCVALCGRTHSDWQRSIGALYRKQQLQHIDVKRADEAGIREAFSLFDADANGTISAFELTSLLTWSPKGKQYVRVSVSTLE